MLGLLLLLLSRVSPVRPHRRQPARLPRPWDSPGKNTGVGCHFLLQCMKVKSESEVAQLCPALCDPMDCSPSGSSVHRIFQARVLGGVPLPFPDVRSRCRYIHHKGFPKVYFLSTVVSCANPVGAWVGIFGRKGKGKGWLYIQPQLYVSVSFLCKGWIKWRKHVFW